MENEEQMGNDLKEIEYLEFLEKMRLYIIDAEYLLMKEGFIPTVSLLIESVETEINKHKGQQ